MAVELDSGNYDAVRIALGFGGDDTDSLPNAVIDAVQFLPTIELMVSDAVADSAAGCGDEDDLADVHIQTALVYLTAAELAGSWLLARERERVKRQSLEGLSVDYADTNVLALGAGCRARGIEALARACPGAASTLLSEVYSGSIAPLVGKGGPTDGKTASELQDERVDTLVPWVMGGP